MLSALLESNWNFYGKFYFIKDYHIKMCYISVVM